jgi:hypothetical protein
MLPRTKAEAKWHESYLRIPIIRVCIATTFLSESERPGRDAESSVQSNMFCTSDRPWLRIIVPRA